ncbi:MAG TPA: MerR family transcriptional regulator [Lentimicrobium sp.]|jgi:DNA-binding transcriptional MerR regulator|nr:MerR family transcriptional regulator [Lentimicrobium sp.]
MIRYSIKDLEQLSGIKAHTIRIWEKRYGLFDPERTPTNIRYYSDDDLKKLLNVTILNRNGFKISNIVSMDNHEMNDRIIEISDSFHDFTNQIEQLTLAMIDFDEVRFERVLSSSVIKIGFDETVTRILYPFFERIGVLWQIGTIYPAQEHFVSNLIRQKLIIAIDGQLGNLKEKPSTFLLFLPPNEWHELGLLFFNYLIRKAGHNVIYLGQSLPLEDLAEIKSKQHIDYLFTSFTTPMTNKKFIEIVSQISDSFTDNKIYLTGIQVAEHEIEFPSNIEVIKQPRKFLEEIGLGVV